jgi:adhesin HecA-like repeat protein
MGQRGLLSFGVIGVATALLIGAIGIAAGGFGFSTMGLPGGSSVSMDSAQQSVQSFLDRTGNKDLRIDELMEFDQNFYALVKEQSTGIGAFELLVNKRTAAVAFEPGPDMMWNTKYSMMGRGGMMGGGSFGVRTPVDAMTVSSDRATQIAQGWLDNQSGGYSAGTADAFYGYYTFHFESNGRVAGMLSINGYGGQVWLHTWHGSFIQARDFGA